MKEILEKRIRYTPKRNHKIITNERNEQENPNKLSKEKI